MVELVSRCGICNAFIRDGENWTETDCVICEACSERCKNEALYGEDGF